MRLHRLRLLNFRQHADTDLVLGPGITGIIGPNGSGKTTLLEAIAWAIYGNAAARGDKESIRNLRAKPRSSVRVEMEFGVGAHEYKVVRGLHNAELYQDGRLVANSLTEVTAKLERGLGMTHDEFFNTYFTGQKDLAVMAQLSRPERAAFLSRVLRYEQLSLAQERIREQKTALAAELHGREAGLPEQAALERERAAAGARLEQARRAAAEAEAARARAQQADAREEPRWREWVEKEKRVHSLDGDRRMADQAVTVAKQECERLDREMAEALKARDQLDALQTELEPIERLKREQAELEHLQKEETARRADEGQLAELMRTIVALDRRIGELAPATEALAGVEREAGALGERLEVAERTAEEQRAAWVREKEYATTRRADLLKQYDEVKEQRDKIEQLGPEGTCPTCRRPLGAEYAEVLGVLDRQMQAIVEDGKYFRQRLEQLGQPPATLAPVEAARDALLVESRRASERAGELRAQLEERDRAVAQRRGLEMRARVLDGLIRARPTGYDRQRHDVVRAELTKLEPVALEAAKLAEAGVREVQRRAAERAAQERQIAELKVRLRLHHELDRGFGDLRAELNAAMRPEIAELASGFLADLTDGRYEAVDLNDDYVVTIIDDGVSKPVISGGEEDVANLALRLAISQMIAERAGQPLTLLVLDEIFGSLDESRRQHVVALLRRLADRFPQVVLITHIEQVREGLDRVIRVDYDVGQGASVVRDDTATLGAADAGVAA